MLLCVPKQAKLRFNTFSRVLPLPEVDFLVNGWSEVRVLKRVMLESYVLERGSRCLQTTKAPFDLHYIFKAFTSKMVITHDWDYTGFATGLWPWTNAFFRNAREGIKGKRKKLLCSLRCERMEFQGEIIAHLLTVHLLWTVKWLDERGCMPYKEGVTRRSNHHADDGDPGFTWAGRGEASVADR